MRQQLNLNKCLGITKYGELIMVDYLFNDELHGKPFHGATGSRFVGITQHEIDERNDLDNVVEFYGYLWEEAVKSGDTTESQEVYMQNMIDSEVNFGEGLFFGHDTSGIYSIPDAIKKMHFDGCETFECIGGGRMFPIKEEEMMIIFDQDLWNAVNMIESEPYDLEMFADIFEAELKLKGA